MKYVIKVTQDNHMFVGKLEKAFGWHSVKDQSSISSTRKPENLYKRLTSRDRSPTLLDVSHMTHHMMLVVHHMTLLLDNASNPNTIGFDF